MAVVSMSKQEFSRLEAGRGVEKDSNGMPPNLLAHYFYLWEPTVVRQTIETARTFASVSRTFVELLCQQDSVFALPKGF